MVNDMTTSVSNRRLARSRCGRKLWGAQTQRSLQHFSIGHRFDPARNDHRLRVLKRAAPLPTMPRSPERPAYKLITQVCDEILADQHRDMFPLHSG